MLYLLTYRIFEVVARYCEAYNNLIPVAFVLGFYVAIVVERWNLQFNNVPWPDRLALFVTASVKGADDRGRLMRRTIMRYVCLSYVITMASISPPVKKRFPTFTHMTEAGNGDLWLTTTFSAIRQTFENFECLFTGGKHRVWF